MNDIRIIALDLDGTLLDSNKRISERNMEALRRAAKEGIEIIPTTGRFYGMLPKEIRDLPFVRHAITINGAEVHDCVADCSILRDEIPLEMAIRILETLDGYDVIYDCYRRDWGWITESFKDKVENYSPDVHFLKMLRDFRTPVAELKRHLRDTAADGGVQKIMFFAPNHDRALAAKILGETTPRIKAAFPDIAVTASTWNNVELNISTANKGNAMLRFAETLGLSAENCMAFGDGMNDLSMVEAAGIGVAMGNAVSDVKHAAKWIAPTNDEDGVAEGIEKWIFGR